MFKLRNISILCTKWAHFKFDACYWSQNSWDGCISSSFQNSLKMSGHQCYEFLEFWCWNLVPGIGERCGLQASQFSTRTLLRNHAFVIAAVCGFALSCWNTQGLPWNRRRLEGSICCSKTFIYLPAFIVPSKTFKLPIPYALMQPHTIRDAGFCTECW